MTPDQAGWYDDPHDPQAQRYWDGQDWTPHRQRKPLARQAPVAAPVQPLPPPQHLPPPPPAQLPPPRGALPPPTGQRFPPPPPPTQLPPPPPGAYPSPPSDASSGPGRRSRTGIPKIAAVIAVVAVLAVAGGVVYKFVLGGGSNHDEDGIRAVVQQEQAAYNNSDYNAYLQTLCAVERPQQESQLKWVTQDRAANDKFGPIQFSLTNIKVSGDTATGSMSINGQKEPEARRTTVAAQFLREQGAWKDCSPSWSH
jgi:hypothetical protein